MDTSRRDAITLTGAVLTSGFLGSAAKAQAAPATPQWGAWTTHIDSAGQAATMASSFNEGNTALSLLFDKMEISLQGKDQANRAASVVLAGHYPIAVPDEFNLNGFFLIARGQVSKSPNSSAMLTLSLGDTTRSFEWPRRPKVVDVSTKETANLITEFTFDAECFSGDSNLGIGDPPKFGPLSPLTLAIGMYARRNSADEDILFQVSSVDIVILDLVKA
ncbi:MAG: hypothetical protein AB7S70_11015 [Hyphomicrobium sp.]|uniref:hypothetical protein n=1 Tax=Hyphomicrobium sp. TaxID=82 RepID=UPI003D13DFF4